MFILFRLFRLVILLALILVVVGVIGLVAGRPFVERLAARSIEDRIGTPVSVSIATSVEPGALRGELGNVTVKATQFERDGLRLAGTQAVYHGVDVDVSDLISGDVRLHYSSVVFNARLTQAALTRVPAGRSWPSAACRPRRCASRSATGAPRCTPEA